MVVGGKGRKKRDLLGFWLEPLHGGVRVGCLVLSQ